MRGAELDRLLEVGAHPHGQGPEAVALGDLGQQGKMGRRRVVERRNDGPAALARRDSKSILKQLHQFVIASIALV